MIMVDPSFLLNHVRIDPWNRAKVPVQNNGYSPDRYA
jgi:hypothetical protein